METKGHREHTRNKGLKRKKHVENKTCKPSKTEPEISNSIQSTGQEMTTDTAYA